MPKQTFTPAIDLLIPSIQVIRQNLPTYFVLMVLPYLLITYGMKDAVFLSDFFTPIVVVGLVLSLVFYAPLVYTQTHTSAGREVSLAEAFSKGYAYFWRLIGLNIIFGMLVIGGMILFIIPGLIVLRRYYLSFYYLVDKDLSIKNAMEHAAKESKKKPWAIYGILGILFLFTLFGLFSVVGAAISAVLTMLYAVAPALRYQEFQGKKFKADDR